MKTVICVIALSEEEKACFRESIDADFIFTTPEALTEQELSVADAVIGNISPGLLKSCQNLKLFQLFSAGTDGYTAPGVLPKGTKLCNATGAYGLAISEHMLGMTLMLMKKLHLYRDQEKLAQWKDAGPVTSIMGATTLVLGMGDIGSEYAWRMNALGSRVIGIRRTPSEKPDFVDVIDTTENFRNYLPEADIIAMSLPGTPQTYHLIGEREFEMMKPGAILLNVGRGSAIDPAALEKALTEGTLGACGIDVTEPEPLPADSPLWKLENLLITPHISGGFHLAETRRRILNIAMENLKALETGGPFRNIVDLSTGYRKR